MGFTQREARHLIRKAVGRVPEGESIRHLNIMPMMDMMTILLVAFIFQLSTSTLETEARTVNLPSTESDQPLGEKSRIVVITPIGIVIPGTNEGKAIVSVHDNGGDVDPSEKETGAQGRRIPKLATFLANLHSLDNKALLDQGRDPNKEPPPELLIIADRQISYRLLIEVMFTAKSKDPPANYKRFRLIVQKNFPPVPSK